MSRINSCEKPFPSEAIVVGGADGTMIVMVNKSSMVHEGNRPSVVAEKDTSDGQIG